jgi:hypothetical protein
LRRFFLSLLGVAFLFGSVAFAVNPTDISKDKSPSAKVTPAKPAPAKPLPRETRMRATGIIKEMTGDTLRIERTVTAELMEFLLEKPLDKINVGDKVNISYIKKEEKNIAKRVSKDLPKKKVISTPDGKPALRQPPPPVK